MRRFVGVSWGAVGLVVGLLVGTALGPTAAVPERHERVLVFGDSMTAQYTDDPGDPMQGWWSIVGERHGLEMVTSAQGGGGLLKKGSGCYGTAVRERASRVVERVRPTMILVAVGYNDKTICINGRGMPINAGFRSAKVASALEQIGAAAESVGMKRSDVVVTVPWGSLRLAERGPVVSDFAAGAKAAGLRFVNVRRFQAMETIDKTHPNRLGATVLADALERTVVNILRSRTGPPPSTAPTTPPPPAPSVTPESELAPEIVPDPALQAPPPQG